MHLLLKKNKIIYHYKNMFLFLIYLCINLLGLPYKYHRLGSLNNRNLFFSHRLKIKVSAGFVYSEGHEVYVPGLSSWFANVYLLLVSSHDLPSLCICDQIFSSYKDTSYTDLMPTLMTSF